jgi:IS30 family transposase
VKITEDMIAEAEELAKLGASTKAIAEALGISPHTASRPGKLREAIRRGKAQARIDTVRALKKKLQDGDTQAAIFVAKQLQAYEEGMEIGSIKTIRDIADALARLAEAVMRNEITPGRAEMVERVLSKYAEAHRLAEEERRSNMSVQELMAEDMGLSLEHLDR